MNIMILMKIFKTINEKFDDNDFINDNANINFIKRNS